MTTLPKPMESLAQQWAHLSPEVRQAALASLAPATRAALPYLWPFWARPEQLPPPGDWHTWVIMAGRGAGKTKSGGHWTNTQAYAHPGCRIALVAETAADARDVMIEGSSGIIASSPPTFRPVYEPSKRRITWPNGSLATAYSAETPDQLRGPEHFFAWIDEFAKFRYPQDILDTLELGLRLGANPRIMVTTTPRPIPSLRELLADPMTVVTRGSTYDNLANLPQTFIQRILQRYEGTRLGRQEIHAEMLGETPGALFTRALLEQTRVTRVPPLERIAVGLDPGTDAGIVVCGLGEDGHGYVLDDLSISGSPTAWAKQAISGYHKYGANLIVAEKNHGGDMVTTTLATIDETVAVKTVWASQGKYARAEPVSTLYEKGRIHHVGMFAALEDQMVTWVPDEGLPSPDRLDAMVWACTVLMLSSTHQRDDDALPLALGMDGSSAWDLR